MQRPGLQNFDKGFATHSGQVNVCLAFKHVLSQGPLKHAVVAGIEYSGITRCELWTRPEGIQFTTEKPGFTCAAEHLFGFFFNRFGVFGAQAIFYMLR